MDQQDNIKIRVAKISDVEKLLAIYSPYVTDTAITFEYQVPTLSEFSSRIESISKKYPYLVACMGEKIVGYAYASEFKERKAYDWSVELSIYVEKTHKGQGIGKALYRGIEDILRLQNVKNMNACIAVPCGKEDPYLTRDSINFHSHMGFSLVGEFHQCGFKFDRWYNMAWMEKFIGSHDERPKDFIPFPDISPDV